MFRLVTVLHTPTPVSSLFDVCVVGGGPAGLSAALMLGRCRRRVLVCDLGQPRNRRTTGLHGYLTRDGIPPLEFNDLGRRELPAYGVELRRTGVTGARWLDDHYGVALSDGSEERARFLLIATGVVDDLPGVAGLEDCYGRSVFHCPYCDGWEWRDRRLAALGRGVSVARLALALKAWSQDVVICSNGERLEHRERSRLMRNGITVRTELIARLDHQDGRLRGTTRDGRILLPAGTQNIVLANTAYEYRETVAVTMTAGAVTQVRQRRAQLCRRPTDPEIFRVGSMAFQQFEWHEELTARRMEGKCLEQPGNGLGTPGVMAERVDAGGAVIVQNQRG